MAIIYSYPLNDDIKPLDELVGTTEKSINGQLKTVTRNFLLQDLAEFFIVDGGLQKEIILTTNSTSGAASLNQSTGVLNIPQYQGALLGTGFVKSTAGVISYDTNSYYLASNPNGFIPLTALSSSATGLAYNNTTGVFSLTIGYSIPTTSSQTNWDNAYTYRLAGITTNGTSGAATLINNILNIPQYSGGGGSQNLQQVTDVGSTTTNSITANSFIKTGGSGSNILLDNGTTLAISSIIGSQNLQQVLNQGNTSNTGIILSIGGTQGVLINLEEGAVGLAVSTIGGSLASYPLIFANEYASYFQVDNGGNLLSLGSLEAYSFVKSGGLSTEYLMADGSVTTGSPSGGGSIPHATASGTDTYTATITGVVSYSDGDAFLIRFPNGNTTSATLNINSLGARSLYRNNDGPLIGGDITSGGEMLCIYNTTLSGFQCIGTSPNSLFSYVKNDDSVTITKGMPVYAFSGTGDRMTVKRAKNTGDATSAQTVGLVLSTSIAAGQKGIIMMQGLLDGLSILPTTTWTDGDPVYLGSTDGSITNIKPYAPNHLVYLGVVTTASNGSAGRMYVRVQNGYELDELHNVQARTPLLKDTLWYDNTVSPAQWKTSSISTILGYTPANDSNVVHKTGDETIAGIKTFSSNPKIPINYGNSGVGSLIIDNGLGELGVASNYVYPNLTELSYLRGITSSVQTQINSKQATLTSSIFGSFVNALNLKSFLVDNDSVSINDSADSNNAKKITWSLVWTAYLKNKADALYATIANLDLKQDKSLSAYTLIANNTNATANGGNQAFKSLAQQTYTGTIVVTATTSPSGATNHSYSFTQVGKLVALRINLDWATTGNTVSAIACELPSDCPTPEIPTAAGSTGDVIVYGTGTMSASRSIVGAMGIMALRIKSSGVYELVVTRTGASFNKAYYSVQYLTT